MHCKFALTAGMVLAVVAGPSAAANITWDVHGGLWSVAGNWIGGVPSNAVPYDNVFITNPGRVEEVVVDISGSVNALTLSDGGLSRIPDSLTLLNNLSLSFHGGGLVNDGHIFLQSTGSSTTLSFVGAQTIAGRGEIVMSDSGANRITINNTVLQHGNGFGHEIRGAGQILANTGGLVNLGTIRQQGASALTIDPNALGVDNDGLLVAEGSGGLQLSVGSFDNTGGEIRAGDGSHVDMVLAEIIGGTLSTIGSGVILPSASSFEAVTNLGRVVQLNNTSNTIRDGLVLNGTWELNSSGSNTQLTLDGNQTISGTGEIVMSDITTNRLVNNNAVTTLGAGVTVRGAGQLLANTGGMINQGSIIAEGGNTLTIDPNGLGFTQAGVLQAAGPGGLVLVGGVFDLNNPVEVLAGSALQVNVSTLVGGALDIAPGVQADIRSSTLDAMTINGDVLQANNTGNTIVNGLTLNGRWTLNSGGSNTQLTLDGNQTISGTGEIVMSDITTNRLVNNNAVTTLGAGVTVRGAGQLLANTGGMINQGSIIAEGGNALTIDPNGLGFENRGSVLATGSGGILSNDDFLQTAGETVVNSTFALAPGHLLQLAGGTLAGTGTIDGDVLNTAGIVTPGNSPGTLVIDGDYSQAAGASLAIEIAGLLAGEFDVLDISGAASIDGQLTVSLLNGFLPGVGDAFDIVLADSITGLFANGPFIDAGLAVFEVAFIDAIDGDRIRLTTVSAVPLPAAVWLLAPALAGLAGCRRRRRAD